MKELLESLVGKKVSIKMKNGRRFNGVLEKWYEYHNGIRYFSYNIRNVRHNIIHWDIESIKELSK